MWTLGIQQDDNHKLESNVNFSSRFYENRHPCICLSTKFFIQAHTYTTKIWALHDNKNGTYNDRSLGNYLFRTSTSPLYYLRRSYIVSYVARCMHKVHVEQNRIEWNRIDANRVGCCIGYIRIFNIHFYSIFTLVSVKHKNDEYDVIWSMRNSSHVQKKKETINQ